MIRTQSPGRTGRYVTPPKARPAESQVPPGVIERFSQQQLESARWMTGLDAELAAITIMASPFLKVVTYSVLDGCRLMAAHNRRHFEQAHRVMESPGFPSRGQSR
jgi:hypothetical protein